MTVNNFFILIVTLLVFLYQSHAAPASIDEQYSERNSINSIPDVEDNANDYYESIADFVEEDSDENRLQRAERSPQMDELSTDSLFPTKWDYCSDIGNQFRSRGVLERRQMPKQRRRRSHPPFIQLYSTSEIRIPGVIRFQVKLRIPDHVELYAGNATISSHVHALSTRLKIPKDNFAFDDKFDSLMSQPPSVNTDLSALGRFSKLLNYFSGSQSASSSGSVPSSGSGPSLRPQLTEKEDRSTLGPKLGMKLKVGEAIQCMRASSGEEIGTCVYRNVNLCDWLQVPSASLNGKPAPRLGSSCILSGPAAFKAEIAINLTELDDKEMQYIKDQLLGYDKLVVRLRVIASRLVRGRLQTDEMACLRTNFGLVEPAPQKGALSSAFDSDLEGDATGQSSINDIYDIPTSSTGPRGSSRPLGIVIKTEKGDFNKIFSMGG